MKKAPNLWVEDYGTSAMQMDFESCRVKDSRRMPR
jgi:hypothetical protein